MPHPVDIYAGQRLKALRHFAGLSQVQLAKRLGRSFQQIQKYEAGTNRMAASTLYAMAGIFECEIQEFFPPRAGTAPGEAFSKNEIKALRGLHAMPPAIKDKTCALIAAITNGRA